ncbi:MAG TPA: TonB-dependent receptor [Gemmatimonadaceae bacterium]|nr:TonB-dependent receptor [Gemmatimonadaceae bacterium]
MRTLRLLAPLLFAGAAPATAFPQLTVSGRVTNEADRPLPGAQVLIEGTTLRTVAGEDGSYRLTVPSPRQGMVLLVRSISYRPARVPLTQMTGTMNRDFRLTPDVLQLSQVVVTSERGETERSRLGTTVATVGGEDVSRPGVQQIDAGLAGQVSGALVQQMSGTPGGGTSVRIRGLSTLSRSAEPLYIIDGVIVDNSSKQLVDLGGYSSNRLADLDPSEVERVEIVKGAAAAALYGSRANDGVVQIFTKRGQSGALRGTFRTSYQSDDVERRIEVNQAPVNAQGAPVTRYDYQDDIFRTAGGMSSTLSLSGGDERTSFFASGSASQQDGVIGGTDYRRQNLRLNLDHTLNERLRVALSTGYVTSKANVTPNGGLVFNLGVLTSFLFQPNSINLYPDPATGQYPAGFSQANPLEMIANWRAPQEVDRFIGGLHVTAFPIDRMTLSYRLGFDGYTNNSQLWIPRASSAPSVPGGLAISATDRSRLLNSDLDLSYVANPTPRLRFTHGAGINWQQSESDVVTARASNLTLLTGTVQGSIQSSSQSVDERRTFGFYGQEQIALDDRLFVTGSLRSDASSVFGSEERQQWFPKVGAALNLSEYDFWDQFSNIASTLRLRGGYGFSGGQPAGSYDRLSNYISELSGTRSGIANSARRGNEQLKPERASELELGTDIEFAGGRAGIELTYFNKKVTDLILPKSVAPSSGFTEQLANVGELENKGIELLLRTFNLRGPGLTWNSTVTYATNDPVVTAVSDGGAFFIPESFGIIRVDAGQAPGHFFGTTYVRDQQGNILTGSGAPIMDASGVITGIPAIGPREIIGDPNPDAYWSFINDFGVGQSLSFRVQFDGVRGGHIFNFDRRLLETPVFGSGKAYEAELLGEVPVGYFQARRSIFEEYIEDGTWTKLRELSATYSLPAALTQRFRLHGAQLTLAGRNLKTWTDYTGWDPETNSGAQRTLVRGFSFATTPIPRSVSLSFSTNF